MNSLFYPTAAKIRRMFLVAALVACPFFGSVTGMAQSVATGTLTSSGLNSITITSNQTFILTLAVTTNFAASGYTVFYQSDNGTGLFSVGVPRTNLSPTFVDPIDGPRPIFNDATTLNGTAFGGNAGMFLFGPSMHSNQFDLGYTGDQVNNQAAGSYSLQSVQINALNAGPGVYTIFLDARTAMTDRTGGGFTDVNFGGAGGPIFTITVIPEPTTVGLAVLGGAVLLVVAWRKQRARAQA